MYIKVVVSVEDHDRSYVVSKRQPKRIQVVGLGKLLVHYEFDPKVTESHLNHLAADAIPFKACDENYVLQAAPLDPVQHMFEDRCSCNWYQTFRKMIGQRP